MIRVVIADDHAIVRDGLRRLLDDLHDVTVVGFVADGAAVLDAVLDNECDVLVLDLSLPNRSGSQVLDAVIAHAPRVRTIILSMYPEDQMSLHLLKQGALAYLSKDRSPDEIIAAIRSAAKGQRYVTPTLVNLAFEVGMDGDGPPHQQLTSREYQVFIQIVDGKTINGIGDELCVSASTISNHVSAIKRKLGTDSVAGVVRYAARIGLV